MKCPFCKFKAKYRATTVFQKSKRHEYRYVCLKCAKYPVHLWFNSQNQLKDWRCNFESVDPPSDWHSFKYVASKVDDGIEIRKYGSGSHKIVLKLPDAELTPQQAIDKFYNLIVFS